MEIKRKKPLMYVLLFAVAFIVIGTTIAYYTSSDTFNNEFNTGTYKIETQENFESPDNWTPGTTTPKTVIATNKGNTPAAVRIKLTPSWVDANGDSLPLKDNDDNEAAIINFASNLNSKWIYDNGYYYYKRALNENQSTTSLLESVTFNPNFDINNIKDCESEDGVTTCITEFTDYSGGKYTLQVEIETAQFDQYKNIWGTTIELKEPLLVDGMLMKHDGFSNKTFGKSISRDNFESITTVDNTSVPSGAIDNWDVSSEQNGSVIAWYLDVDQDSKYELYIGQEDGVKANPDSSYAFNTFRNVETIDLTYFDISDVTNMSFMFSNSGYNATTFDIVDLSGWDTSKVTRMYGMFSKVGYNSTTWNIGDLSEWDTSSVIDMGDMFFYAGYNATAFDIGDLSEWDTSSVIDMGDMFGGLGYNATTFDIGDLSEWDTSNVENMSSMFAYSGYNATTFDIGDLSEWDTSKATTMASMFAYSGRNATTWHIGDLSEWDTSNVTSMINMFCQAGRNATTWNSIGTLKVYETSIEKIFERCINAKATLNIYNSPTSYTSAFSYAATTAGSGITVNYSSAITNIDNIIATKSSNSNVVKGSQLD